MAGHICLRCLSRPKPSSELNILRSSSLTTAQSSPFSTSSSAQAQVLKKKPVVAGRSNAQKGGSFKQGKQRKSNAPAKSGKAPAPGDRRALRKRVVLSNTNALEVQGLLDLTSTNAEANQGQVLGFSNEIVDALRALEAFKPTQGWSMFRRPATLMRKETIELSQALEKCQKGDRTTIRRILHGERGCGKSVLMLQAMAVALLKRWVVIHIPEANDLTIGHTAYAPDSDGESPLYTQPTYTASLLGAIAKANYNVLSGLRLSQKHDLPIPVQENISLVRFAELGAKDPDIAWPIYRALMSELTAPSQSGEGLSRPPIMFAVDAVNLLMRNTAYLSVEMQKIHAHDLALVNHFIQLLSGKQTLPNGGMILAADASSNRAAVPTFDFMLQSKLASKEGQPAPQWNPFAKIDQRCVDAMEGVEVMKLHGLSKEEAKGIMEYYAKSGMLRQTVNDTLISEKWTLSGGGMIGALERAAVMLRL